MRHDRRFLACLALSAAIAVNGCDCGDDGTPSSPNPDSGIRRDGGVIDMDGTIGVDTGPMSLPDGTTDMDGFIMLPDGAIVPAMDSGPPGPITLPDGAILLPDGAIVGCLEATCEGHLYQCGDCIDNDADGTRDSGDTGCLNPCDNEETSYDLDIPGGDSSPCHLDCYYDTNQGSGNDGCSWDARCDMLMPDPDPACAYNPTASSADCPDPQPTMCHDVCSRITPNGCDCFGCCELPAGSGRYVFIGSVPERHGAPSCRLEDVLNDALCHPCTPVGDCLNTCERCELCLGRTTLPPDCLLPPDAGTPPPPVDAGSYPDGAPIPYDSGPARDAGTPPPPVDGGTPTLRCPDGRQPCGLPTDPPCPASYYCLTGCCTYFG